MSNASVRDYYIEGEFIPAPASQPYYYGIDQVGSIRRVFVSTSSAPAYSFDPYGNPLQSTASTTDLRFAGILTNADSGLNLTWYRVYNTSLGIWNSRDPLGEIYKCLEVSLYNYVDNELLGNTDTQGLFPSPGPPPSICRPSPDYSPIGKKPKEPPCSGLPNRQSRPKIKDKRNHSDTPWTFMPRLLQEEFFGGQSVKPSIEILQPLSEPKSFSDELFAVAEGRKAMSFFSASPDSDFLAFISSRAKKMGLRVVEFEDEEVIKGISYCTRQIYVFKNANRWRVDAHRALVNIMNRNASWSFGAEEYQSFLLGYKKEMIEEWIKFKKSYQPTLGCVAAYLISSQEYVIHLKEYGLRCLVPHLDLKTSRLIIPRTPSTPKKNALDLIPAGFVLARLALAWPVVLEVFQDFANSRSKKPFVRALLDRDIRLLNKGLRSNIELLENRKSQCCELDL